MNIAVLLLAGSSIRLENDTPKQFIEINEKPLFLYSLESFANHPEIDHIILVIREQDYIYVEYLLRKFEIKKQVDIVFGGKERSDSINSAIEYIKSKSISPTSKVLIHDSARALLSSKIIQQNIKMLDSYNAVGTYVKCNDSIAKGVETIEGIIPRDNVLLAQTPQSFIFETLIEIYKNYTPMTDDVSLAISKGIKVGVVNGSPLNFKITTKEDLALLRKIVE